MTAHLAWLAAYALAQLALGAWIARRVRSAGDFFVAGRRLGPGLLFSTMLAANIGAGSTVGATGLGYADGLRRDSWRECEVLVGGRRRHFAGTVTMDQSMVDCGNDLVSVGDEAVLIGAQGDGRITVNEWARRLGTIGYEVTCAISARVPRRWVP
jgi:hypothetical protein